MPNKISPKGSDVETLDPKSAGQWYYGSLKGSSTSLNVDDVWDDYTGNGIVVGVLDSQVAHTATDLAENYDASKDIDLSTGSTDLVWDDGSGIDKHGTQVAGVIGAEKDNGVGTAGVAHGASITSFAMDYTSNNVADQANQGLRLGATVDVLNASWSYVTSFSDNLSVGSEGYEALKHTVEHGRDGLGTVVVFSGGNTYDTQSSNYHGYQNSPYTIAVAAVDKEGDASSYSSMGANLLVSAAGDFITTTDPYTHSEVSWAQGTSFAAPIVSGTVALVLEANSALGYRDVMEIIALSAKAEGLGTDARGGLGWVTNGTDNFNGGGMHFSDSYGFGCLDAHSAVRLAEAWHEQKTFENLVTQSETQSFNNAKLVAGTTDHVQLEIDFNQDISMETVQLQLQLDWRHSNDIELFLTSPDGTVSQLMYDFKAKNGGGSFENFAFSSNAVFGESSQGTWTIDIYNRNPEATNRGAPMEAEIKAATITVHGSEPNSDDVYHYNDEFGRYYQESEIADRSKLSDDDGGVDTINTVMVTDDVRIDLTGQTTSKIAGRTLDIHDDEIENIFAGDGDDHLIGSAKSNTIDAGRGNDKITLGASGNDKIDGGHGTDTVELNFGFSDIRSASVNGAVIVLVYALPSGEFTLQFENVEHFLFSDTSMSRDLLIQNLAEFAAPETPDNSGETEEPENEETAEDATPEPPEETAETEEPETPVTEAPSEEENEGAEQEYTYVATTGTEEADSLVAGKDHDLVNAMGGDDTVYGRTGNDILNGDAGDDALYGASGADQLNGGAGNDKVKGGSGDDQLIGGEGHDHLSGGCGSDVAEGGLGNDIIAGGADDDRLFGNEGDDTLNGGDGNDLIDGGAGNDRLISGTGNDTMKGGLGDDILISKGGETWLHGGEGADKLIGSSGKDTFVFSLDDGSVDKVQKFDALDGDTVVVEIAANQTGNLVYENTGNGTMLSFTDGDTTQDIAFFSGVDNLSSLTELAFL